MTSNQLAYMANIEKERSNLVNEIEFERLNREREVENVLSHRESERQKRDELNKNYDLGIRNLSLGNRKADIDWNLGSGNLGVAQSKRDFEQGAEFDLANRKLAQEKWGKSYDIANNAVGNAIKLFEAVMKTRSN